MSKSSHQFFWCKKLPLKYQTLRIFTKVGISRMQFFHGEKTTTLGVEGPSLELLWGPSCTFYTFACRTPPVRLSTTKKHLLTYPCVSGFCNQMGKRPKSNKALVWFRSFVKLQQVTNMSTKQKRKWATLGD